MFKKSWGQKTDTIVHINNNILTGEIRKFNYGVVTWKMDGMGTINFESVNIKSIQSNKLFEIKTKNGQVYYGRIQSANIFREVIIQSPTGETIVSIDDIVEIYPIKRNFWMKLRGNFSLGFNYTKGSDVATLDISGDLNYRKEKSYFELKWNNNNTYRSTEETAVKADLSLTWERLLKKRWSMMFFVNGSQNTELNTKSRFETSVLGIKDLMYNISQRVYTGGGLNASTETSLSDNEVSNDLAGVFTLGWKVYKFTSPKVSVDSNINYFPYLTSDRYRIVFNLNPQVSIFNNDFKIGVKYYYTYDSAPLSQTESAYDSGINLQLTYSLH